MLSASCPCWNELAVGGVPTVFRRPVGDAVAALAHRHLAAAGRLRRGDLDLPGQREAIFGAKVPLADARAVDQHLNIGAISQLAAHETDNR